MRERHPRIPALTVELVPVYRCGGKGRRWRRQWVAYRAAAQKAWLDKYCCCEDRGYSRKYAPGPGSSGGEWCECHSAPERDETTKRLARWLRCDGRVAAVPPRAEHGGKRNGGGR